MEKFARAFMSVRRFIMSRIYVGCAFAFVFALFGVKLINFIVGEFFPPNPDLNFIYVLLVLVMFVVVVKFSYSVILNYCSNKIGIIKDKTE